MMGDDALTTALTASVEQAERIVTEIERLAGHENASWSLRKLARASQVERNHLRELVAESGPTIEACRRASHHLRRLEAVLDLLIGEARSSCRGLADRLAVLEEFVVVEP